MNRSRTPGRGRRVLRKLAVAAAVVAPAGAIAVAAAQPVHAATCRTNGHVYVTSLSPWSIRYEDQPIAGGSDQYQLFAGNSTSFRVGGNGLRPGSTPFFSVQSSNGNSFQFNGRSTGSNCVANETNAYVPLLTQPGEVWTVTANYDAGNSGRAVRGQSHFQVTFVAPPPPPDPVSYPDDPFGCGYGGICNY